MRHGVPEKGRISFPGRLGGKEFLPSDGKRARKPSLGPPEPPEKGQTFRGRGVDRPILPLPSLSDYPKRGNQLTPLEGQFRGAEICGGRPKSCPNLPLPARRGA